jgi:dihydroflavonol-4-reductase
MDVRRLLCNEIPAIPSGGVNFVDVRDVAPACLTPWSGDEAGQRYLLGGPNWTFAEFLGRLGRIARSRRTVAQAALALESSPV